MRFESAVGWLSRRFDAPQGFREKIQLQFLLSDFPL
jgi:hypothetical protein